MRPSVRSSLFVAAAFVAGSAAPTFGVPSGNINGTKEQPRIADLDAIIALEGQAKAMALGVPQNEPIPAGTVTAINGLLNQAIEGLDDLFDAIENGGPYQDTTLAKDAMEDIDDAADSDANAKTKMMKGKKAQDVVKDLAKAESKKVAAKARMTGLSTTPKDAAAIAANYSAGPGTVVHDADISGNKKDMSISREDIEKKRADAMNARARAMLKKYPKSDLQAALVSTAAFKPVPDYYYAFEGTTSEAGYIFKSFGRQLFGPFDVHFQVGAFDLESTNDTGSACVEFDVEGSSPLQFVAVCGRRVEGGVQVFVQSHNGAAGNLYFANTRVAQVLVSYSGTAFTVKAAAGQFAPDFVLATVGTVSLTQGSTALIAGMGASGLKKGAVIGLDEIYFDAK